MKIGIFFYFVVGRTVYAIFANIWTCDNSFIMLTPRTTNTVRSVRRRLDKNDKEKNKIENENGECVKETTSRPYNRQQQI